MKTIVTERNPPFSEYEYPDTIPSIDIEDGILTLCNESMEVVGEIDLVTIKKVVWILVEE